MRPANSTLGEEGSGGVRFFWELALLAVPFNAIIPRGVEKTYLGNWMQVVRKCTFLEPVAAAANPVHHSAVSQLLPRRLTLLSSPPALDSLAPLVPARRPLVLHPLAARQLARDLLGPPVAALGRVSLLRGRLHRRLGVRLVLLARRPPRLRARDAADRVLQTPLRACVRANEACQRAVPKLRVLRRRAVLDDDALQF